MSKASFVLDDEPRSRAITPLLTASEVTESIEFLCQMKAEEFHLFFGHVSVTGEQIWACISDKYRVEWPRLHRLVNDILSLKETPFLDWRSSGIYGAGDKTNHPSKEDINARHVPFKPGV